MSDETAVASRNEPKIADRRCHLLDIPPALRLCIYNYLLDDRRTARLHVPHSRAIIWSRSDCAFLAPPLAFALRSWKQIFHEAEPLVKANLEEHLYHVDIQLPNAYFKYPRPPRNAITRQIGACPLLRHVRNLELSIYTIGLTFDEGGRSLVPLRRFFEQIDYGKTLERCHIKQRGQWSYHATATLLEILDDLRCEYALSEQMAETVVHARAWKQWWDHVGSKRRSRLED